MDVSFGWRDVYSSPRETLTFPFNSIIATRMTPLDPEADPRAQSPRSLD